MKKHMIILSVMGMALFVLSCETEDGSPEGDDEVMSAEQIEYRIWEMENCKFPNKLLGTKCCSPKGTFGGTCSVNREWISNGDCNMVDDEGEEVEFCCGGKYLMKVGARGYQCSHEL